MRILDAGVILRQCRKKAKLSQEKLAELLHINQSDVSKLEKGKRTIDLGLFRDWTKVTNSMDLGIQFLYGLDATLLQGILQLSGAA